MNKITLLTITLFLLYNTVFAQKNESEKIYLTGNWEFKQTDSTSKWRTAVVPGVVQTDLFNNKLIPDPFYRTNEADLQWIGEKPWTYRKTFTVDDKFLANEKLNLVFEGLDTYCDVYLNGILLLKADNMYRTWSIDCKGKITKGENKLEIEFWPPRKYSREMYENLCEAYMAYRVDENIVTRKAQYHYGWDWGPVYVTCGIWRPVYIETWNSIKVENVQIVQKSLTDKLAQLVSSVEINSTKEGQAKISILSQNSTITTKEIELKKGLNKVLVDFKIQNPIRWYPATHGKPHLYSFTTKVEMAGKAIESNTRVGLRTIEVVCKDDANGRSFYFVVNGNPMFMKGANWIPADIFLTNIKEDEYKHLIQSAIDANMNMLRVWGGGIYEEDRFYDLCDEMGVLIWQDLMFACTKVPANASHLESIKQELIENVKRIRNHPSIALWCGNNEIEWLTFRYGADSTYTQKWWDNYGKIFHDYIPKVLKEVDTTRFYHSGSPSANLADYKTANKVGFGDKHDWGIWHGKEEPYENYEKNTSRFMSEYGFQSFPSYATMEMFSIPSDWNLESDVMKAHQKCVRGNEKIMLYWNRDFKKPKDFRSFIYGNQVLQGIIVKYGIESHRRKMPYCMGSLYWQLNDCWPVASWSSIDHLGKWKALHYMAKNAFSPILVSPKVESNNISVFVISDKLTDIKAKLLVQLIDFDGKVLKTKELPIVIKQNTSQEYLTLKRDEFIGNYDPSRLLIRVKLSSGNELLSSNELYLLKVKDLNLPSPKVNAEIVKSGKQYIVRLTTKQLAKNVYLSVGADKGFFSDNFFDLVPGDIKEVVYTPEDEITDLAKVLYIKILPEVFQ